MGGRTWAWATLAGLLPAGVAYATGGGTQAPWWPLLLVLPAAWVTRPAAGSRGGWWLATGLCATAVLAGVRARNLVDAATDRDRWPVYDLADAPMPTTPPPYVAVTGFLRDGWILGEYAVAEGDVPDQSRPAEAVLVPMTPTLEGTVRLDGALVVARVSADAPRAQTRVTLYGRTEPLPREIALTLVELADARGDEVSAILVDTLRVPAPREAWTAIALVLGLAGGAVVGFGVAGRTGAPPKPTATTS
jgi:hypothetical protein